MYFSSAVATAENRSAFARAMLELVERFELDGIQIEYVSSLERSSG